MSKPIELTPEQVAEIRLQYATWHPPKGVIHKLCDTVEALREQLRETREDLYRCCGRRE